MDLFILLSLCFYCDMPNARSQKFTPRSYSKRFVVLVLTDKPRIHLQLTSVYGMR